MRTSNGFGRLLNWLEKRANGERRYRKDAEGSGTRITERSERKKRRVRRVRRRRVQLGVQG
jgi:hypothetical protein